MENGNLSALSNIWNSIGPFNMDIFSHRLILQKKVFLLQQLGFNLNYAFRKYLRGPYCSELATDGYKLNTIDNFNEKNISEEESIKKIKKIGEGHEKDALWFELIAFIVYLKNVENKGREEIKNRILEEKPYLYSDIEFNDACSKLEEIGIIIN